MSDYYELGAANDRISELRPLLSALRDDRDAIAAAQARLQQLATAEEVDRAELEREREAVTAIVDSETGEAVVDAAVEVVAPDGSVVRDETLSMVEADGTVTGLAEDIEEST